MNTHRINWAAERPRIEQWRAEGKTLLEIADIIGTKRPTLHDWVKRWGLGRINNARVPDEKRTEIVDLQRQGLSNREIARRYGIHYKTVQRICAGYGIVKVTKGTWSPDLDEKAKALVLSGLTYSAVGAQLGLTKCQVLSRMRRIGVFTLRRKPKVTKPRLATRGYTRRVVTSIAPPVIDSEIPLEQRKSLLQLERHHCRWPVGDPKDADFFYCGAVIPRAELDIGRRYCAGHHGMAYQPDSAPRQNFFRLAA